MWNGDWVRTNLLTAQARHTILLPVIVWARDFIYFFQFVVAHTKAELWLLHEDTLAFLNAQNERENYAQLCSIQEYRYWLAMVGIISTRE